jgi:diadenosine tetraphosphatase ApaH/serine/threonine PP2A family protein phosphatase
VAYTLAHQSKVVLLRGNHEARRMNTHFNFRQEVLAKYDEETYEQLEQMFDSLPLAALINSPHGRCFCVHGGIGPEVGTVRGL